jgi:hypothetical protein
VAIASHGSSKRYRPAKPRQPSCRGSSAPKLHGRHPASALRAADHKVAANQTSWFLPPPVALLKGLALLQRPSMAAPRLAAGHRAPLRRSPQPARRPAPGAARQTVRAHQRCFRLPQGRASLPAAGARAGIRARPRARLAAQAAPRAARQSRSSASPHSVCATGRREGALAWPIRFAFAHTRRCVLRTQGVLRTPLACFARSACSPRQCTGHHDRGCRRDIRGGCRRRRLAAAAAALDFSTCQRHESNPRRNAP